MSCSLDLSLVCVGFQAAVILGFCSRLTVPLDGSDCRRTAELRGEPVDFAQCFRTLIVDRCVSDGADILQHLLEGHLYPWTLRRLSVDSKCGSACDLRSTWHQDWLYSLKPSKWTMVCLLMP